MKGRDFKLCICVAGADGNTLFNFCGCGWPQHMLLPRGKQEGMPFQIFVMVTDWAQDKVCVRALPSCSIQGLSYTHMVLYLYLFNIYSVFSPYFLCKLALFCIVQIHFCKSMAAILRDLQSCVSAQAAVEKTCMRRVSKKAHRLFL